MKVGEGGVHSILQENDYSVFASIVRSVVHRGQEQNVGHDHDYIFVLRNAIVAVTISTDTCVDAAVAVASQRDKSVSFTIVTHVPMIRLTGSNT
jgi:hypothetical protein